MTRIQLPAYAILLFSAILAYEVIDLCRVDQSFIWVLALPLLGIIAMALWVIVVAGKIDKKLETRKNIIDW